MLTTWPPPKLTIYVFYFKPSSQMNKFLLLVFAPKRSCSGFLFSLPSQGVILLELVFLYISLQQQQLQNVEEIFWSCFLPHQEHDGFCLCLTFINLTNSFCSRSAAATVTVTKIILFLPIYYSFTFLLFLPLSTHVLLLF